MPKAGTTVGTKAGAKAGDVASENTNPQTTNVDATTTGATNLATLITEIITHPPTAVRVNPANLDGAVDWNVTVNGNDLFATNQTSGTTNATVELTPDQFKQQTGENLHEVDFDIRTSNATTGTFDVDVVGLHED